MKGLKPLTIWGKLWAGELPFEIGVAITTLVTGILTGIRFKQSVPPQDDFAFLSFLTAGVLFFLLVFRAIVRNQQALGKGDRHALEGALHTLHAILMNGRADNPNAGIRICVFVPGHRPGEAHQITDYVGNCHAAGRGRDLSCRCGVVGKAFRSGEAQFNKLPNNIRIADYLVAEFGFERVEAANMKQDRRSWAAIPVGAPEAVIAVIYIDSSNADCFGTPRSPCRKSLEAAILGVAKFISQA